MNIESPLEITKMTTEEIINKFEELLEENENKKKGVYRVGFPIIEECEKEIDDIIDKLPKKYDVKLVEFIAISEKPDFKYLITIACKNERPSKEEMDNIIALNAKNNNVDYKWLKNLLSK